MRQQDDIGSCYFRHTDGKSPVWAALESGSDYISSDQIIPVLDARKLAVPCKTPHNAQTGYNIKLNEPVAPPCNIRYVSVN